MARIQVRMPEHDRERSLGHLGVKWIEHFFRHGPGPLSGQPYNLDIHFYDLTTDAYALGEDGRRLYNTVVVSAPKGTSKSEWAAAIALFEAHGPCRFDGWANGGEVFEQHDFTYIYEAGEPMGRTLRDPYIRLLATEEGQTVNTYRNVRSNLALGAPLHTIFSGYREFQSVKVMTMLPGNAQIWPSTASAASKDGGLETFAVADETHLYNTNELRDMYETVDQNLPKRGLLDEPWMLATTTMYQAGQNSVAENQHKLALAIIEGKVPNPNLLYDHIEGGVIEDLTDPDRIREVLLEAYADRDWINYDRYVARAMDPTKSVSRFRRYYLNQQASSVEAFLTDQEVKGMQIGEDGEPIPALAKGDVITLGLDYAPGTRGDGRKTSSRRFRIPDATALIACRLSDMSLHKIGIWEVEDEARALREGWNPPMHVIEQTVTDAFKQYGVVGFFADPSHIEGYLDRWTARYLPQLKVRASQDRPMYRYMSGKTVARFSRDINTFYLAAAEGQLHMAEDLQLARHLLNAHRRYDGLDLKLSKKNTDSTDKTDGAIAAILAHSAAVYALNKGVPTSAKKAGRAYRIY